MYNNHIKTLWKKGENGKTIETQKALLPWMKLRLAIYICIEPYINLFKR